MSIEKKNIKKKCEKNKNKVKDWMFDHLWVKRGINWTWIMIVSTISAFFFAFGFNTFIDIISTNGVQDRIVSGGVSGVSQVIVLFCKVCGWTIEDTHLAYSILYFVLNVPLFVLAWFGIGKQFTIFTIFNVLEVSIFIKLLSVKNIPGLQMVVDFVNIKGGGMLGRALFAGICTGLASSLSFRVDISSGGIDVIAYYIALKKNTMAGKYSFIMNGITLICFTLLSMADGAWSGTVCGDTISRSMYSVIYLFTTTLVIDNINLRNKKVRVDIITNDEALGSALIETIPHGATQIDGKGVFLGQNKYIFTMVVSYYEVDDVIKLIKKLDERAFVQTIPLGQVYGNFYTKPVK